MELTMKIFLIGVGGRNRTSYGVHWKTPRTWLFLVPEHQNMVKKILIGLLFMVVVMQLLQPMKNVSEGISPNDITHVYEVPQEIQVVFTEKCYDCHSNNTHYPWYIHIQPIGWWMASHIKEAKDHLNFSEFKTYNEERAADNLEEIEEEIERGTMPLKSYVWLHADAKVTPEETKAISDWIRSLSGATAEESNEDPH